MDTLKIIGITVATSNQDGKAAHDLGNLWKRFHTENIPGQIADKVSDEIYSIYTDYESDHTGKYLTLIGVQVNTLDDIPEQLTGREFAPQKFKKFIAKGPMPNAVVETWEQIWAQDAVLNRSYKYDYEVYGGRCQNGDLSEVDIFVGVN